MNRDFLASSFYESQGILDDGMKNGRSFPRSLVVPARILYIFLFVLIAVLWIWIRRYRAEESY